MRVACAGWRRFQKYHKLMDRDISAVSPSLGNTYSRDEVHLQLVDDNVCIATGVENLKINGNFSVEIQLSKKEIINLARIALAEEPFGKVIRGLSRPRK
jgi:uncharacterized protein YllA (UPF0747 family)